MIQITKAKGSKEVALSTIWVPVWVATLIDDSASRRMDQRHTCRPSVQRRPMSLLQAALQLVAAQTGG